MTTTPIKFSINNPKRVNTNFKKSNKRKLVELSFDEHLMSDAKCVIDAGCNDLVVLCIKRKREIHQNKNNVNNSILIKFHIDRIDRALCVIAEDSISSKDGFKILQANILEQRITTLINSIVPESMYYDMGYVVCNTKLQLTEIEKMSF
jgi:hypothetical protein